VRHYKKTEIMYSNRLFYNIKNSVFFVVVFLQCMSINEHVFSNLFGCLETVQPPNQMDRLSVLFEHHNSSISRHKEMQLLT